MANKWDLRYDTDEYIYGTAPNTFFRKILDGLKPGRILLPGEGEGRNAVYAAKLGWRVDAVDFSDVARIKAMKLAAENSVEISYNVAPIETAGIDANRYDAMGIFYLHLAEKTRKKVFTRLTRALKPGGYLIMEAFTKKQLGRGTGGPDSLDKLYNPDEILKDFLLLDKMSLDVLETDSSNGNSMRKGKRSIMRLVAVMPYK